MHASCRCIVNDKCLSCNIYVIMCLQFYVLLLHQGNMLGIYILSAF